jgi:predicted esterase
MRRRQRHQGGWRLLIALLLLGCSMVSGCSVVSSPGPSAPPAPRLDPQLTAQVTRYLRADDQEAGRLLDGLAGRSPDELQSALQQLLTGAMLWDQPGIETGALPHRPITVDGVERRYGLYVPPSYRPSRSYPLILCLHGAGFDGDSYLERWAPRLGDRYLLACPSIEDGAWWTREGEALVMAVFNEVARRYHIDRDRVFLTGMSNGGLGTYLIGLNHSDQFAALVPMAGAFPQGFYPLFENARRTPLYLIHGEQDQVIPVGFSRNIAAYLKREKIPAVYIEHERVHPTAGGHFFPKEELPALIAWLAEQQRRAPDVALTVVRDRDHAGRADWLQLDQIDPAVGSFWASESDEEESRRLERGAFARLAVLREGNVIRVTTKGVRRYSLLFYPDAVDFRQPVRIMTNDRVSFEGLIQPESRLLLEEARRRPDPAQLVLAKVEIEVQ